MFNIFNATFVACNKSLNITDKKTGGVLSPLKDDSGDPVVLRVKQIHFNLFLIVMQTFIGILSDNIHS